MVGSRRCRLLDSDVALGRVVECRQDLMAVGLVPDDLDRFLNVAVGYLVEALEDGAVGVVMMMTVCSNSIYVSR